MNNKIDIDNRIDFEDAHEPYENETILGDLTDSQYKALEKVCELSPNYKFTVVQYSGGPSSSATHIKIWTLQEDSDYVGLVGNDTAQFYDKSLETARVCLRVAHRVYRLSGINFDLSDCH